MGRPSGVIRLGLIGVRLDSQPDLIRAAASLRFTDLVDQHSGKAFDAILPASVIVGRSDNTAISGDVYAAAVSWRPGQNHKLFALLSARRRRERNIFATVAGIRTDQPVTRESEIVDDPNEVITTRMFQVDNARSGFSTGRADPGPVQDALDFPLQAHGQVEIHPFRRDPFTDGAPGSTPRVRL